MSVTDFGPCDCMLRFWVFQVSPEKNQVIPKLSQRFFQVGFIHGLRTLNEGINKRYLKNWADVADKICFGRT